MYRYEDSKIYELFNSFIKKVFIDKKDFFSNDSTEIFTKDNVNECINKFIVNPDEGNKSFEEKTQSQFANASENSKRLFSHAIWLWGFSVNESKNCNLIFINEDDLAKNIKRPEFGFANAGQYHLTNKYFEICFCLRLFEAIINKDFTSVDEIKSFIEKLCLCCIYQEAIDEYNSFKEIELVSTYKQSCSMVNILLYLSKPVNYERIVSNGHKQRIANCFETLLSNSESEYYLDKRIKAIRDKLSNKLGDNNFDFYDNLKLYSLWHLDNGNEIYDEFSGLKYKKNIIFYGPPGTSKTYSAKQLAKSFIIRELLSKNIITLEDYLGEKNHYDQGFKSENFISILQLHANYSYDDFIIGQTMNNGKIETKKGYFLELCEKASSNRTYPYILILDEINRVDLARLFGEAFSCIENRNETIVLPYKIDDDYVKLTVPENLYIIGTMNEIDYSLEKLDFALRRRFLWFKHGFDAEVLNIMLPDIDHKDVFIERAEMLNKKICEIRELGDKYEIGHVFFAEIKNIIKQCEYKKLYTRNKLYAKDPIKILWCISIKPLIEAYLDNIDIEIKNNILNELKDILYYGKE